MGKSGVGPYAGRQYPAAQLTTAGTDGNQWPTDDLFVLYRELGGLLRKSDASGEAAPGPISGANMKELAFLIALADTGGTRGHGTAHTFTGTGSQLARDVIADVRAHEAAKKAAKHTGDEPPKKKRR